jgi:hypothetical protein
MFSPLTNLWSTLTGNTPYTLLTHVEANLQTGVEYVFRVRASNLFGWGEFSDSVTIRADEVPAQITPVTTTVESVYVQIAWSAPSTDNGATVLEYRIFIIAQNGDSV